MISCPQPVQCRGETPIDVRVPVAIITAASVWRLMVYFTLFAPLNTTAIIMIFITSYVTSELPGDKSSVGMQPDARAQAADTTRLTYTYTWVS